MHQLYDSHFLIIFFLDSSYTSLLPLLPKLSAFRRYKTAGDGSPFSGTPVQDLTHQANCAFEKFMSSHVF